VFALASRRWFWGLIGGIALMSLWFMVAGGQKSIIQINYNMYPEVLEGAEVVIDDEVVGTLKPIGRNHLTGFEVEDGSHVVSIRHPELTCEPVTIQSGYGGRQVQLLAELGETWTEEGGYQTSVYLIR